MANNRIQVKRTNTAGLLANVSDPANTRYIAAGEFALNMADGILYSSNGSAIIEIGANNTNQRITNSLTINNSRNLNFQTVNTSAAVYFTQQNDDNFVLYSTNTAYGARPVFGVFANSITSNLQIYIPLQLNSGLVANSSLGTAGQVLASNGSSIYWTTVGGTGTVTSVGSGNGLTGGPITGSGTLSVLANNGITANSTGVFAVSGIGTVVNSTGINVNANNGLTATISGVFVNGNNGLTVNSTGVHVLAGAGIVANTLGTFVSQGTGVVVNATGVHVNATYINTISSNSATYLGAIGNFGNTLGIYTGGVVNATTLSTGATFTANSTLVNAAAINVTGAVNTATLYATTSANIASAVQANSTGVWTTGTVNAAILSTTTTFIANSTQVTLAVPLSANGDTGTAGFVLTSNGTTGSPYWTTATGGGYYKGGSASVGTLAGGGQNIFRVNANTLNYNTTIVAGENAQATGPISVAAGITLTVDSGARVSIV